MKYLLAAALATVATAGLSPGACPTITNSLWKPEMLTETEHYLLYMDENFHDQL